MMDEEYKTKKELKCEETEEEEKPPVNKSTLESLTVRELNDLDDVVITSPANGLVLKYNSTSGKWENGAP